MAECELAFKRRFTDAEMADIRAGADQGIDGAFTKMWNIILMESHGLTWPEALAIGARYYPGNFAIPRDQADHIIEFMHGPLEPRLKSLLWLTLGPAVYGEESL